MPKQRLRVRVTTRTIDKTTSNQKFAIVGSGKETTFIRGSAGWDASTSNVLYFRDFLGIEIRNCTIQYGAYGFYPRSCASVKLSNVRFLNCGSDGSTAQHDMSSNKNTQAGYWAGNTTNDGGAMRVRACQVMKNLIEIP